MADEIFRIIIHFVSVEFRCLIIVLHYIKGLIKLGYHMREIKMYKITVLYYPWKLGKR